MAPATAIAWINSAAFRRLTRFRSFNLSKLADLTARTLPVVSYITPPQMKRAVWSSIMHGARGIVWFDHSQDARGPLAGVFYAMQDSPYMKAVQSTETDWGVHGGPNSTISRYDQCKATTCGAVKALASVINSPFALGYVTVSPAGWTFGQSLLSRGVFSGFDVMAKWTGTNFYIFAMPRYSQTLTNQTATFTVRRGSVATVINKSRHHSNKWRQFQRHICYRQNRPYL